MVVTLMSSWLVHWYYRVVFGYARQLAYERCSEVSSIVSSRADDQLWVGCPVKIEQDVTNDSDSINQVNHNGFPVHSDLLRCASKPVCYAGDKIMSFKYDKAPCSRVQRK